MKYELKPDEQLAVDRFMMNHPHAKLLRHYNSWLNFETDDVLVRYRIDNEGKERIDTVSENCSVPKKFKIVYIDKDIRCPWVKNVNVRGGLGSKLYCLTESSGYVYKVDPEYLDCFLIGAKYDPRAQYRSWRRENPSYGGKTSNK